MHLYRNEIERLAQGMPGQNTGTNTMFFIKKNQVPRDRAKDVTYGLITTLIRPEKIDEPNRTRLVAGGDRVHYPGDAGTPTANLLTVKILSTASSAHQMQNSCPWTSRTFTSTLQWHDTNI